MPKRRLTKADIARRRLSDDGLPNPPEPGSYSPKNSRYIRGMWYRNGKVIGHSKTEDSRYFPVNRSRPRGVK